MGKIKMNEKLEKQFKKRLKNSVHIEFKTAQKIKELRNKTFDEINTYFKNMGIFLQINHKIIRQCSAFDRRTEIKNHNYMIGLFIDFSSNDFEIEKYGSEKFKVKIKDSLFKPLFKQDCLTPHVIFKWFEQIPELEFDIRNNQAILVEDNISLNVVPCLDFQDTSQRFTLVPYDDFFWKKLELMNYDSIGGNMKVQKRVTDNILILKHWAHCQNFYDEELDYFLESTIIDYYNDCSPNEFLYEDFNISLKEVYEKRTEFIANKTNVFDDDLFVTKLRKSVEMSNRMVNQSGEESLKCFAEIFGQS